MKKILLSMCVALCISNAGYSQCATTSAPTGNCNYGLNMSAFSLANVASTGNSGCSTNGYGNFTTPVRTLTMGISYPWTATTGNNYSHMGVGIWIDLNNDGFYSANEMVVSDAPGYMHSGSLTIPYTATPGTSRPMRVRCAYYTTLQPTDMCTNSLGYYCETEDYRIDIIAPPPCSGVPAANSVVTPTYQICPNASTTLSLATTYTTYGYTYAWYTSTTSALGPFTAISGASLSAYTTPSLTNSMYYTAVATCTNGNTTMTATAGQVTVATTVINTIPYYENFEGIAYNNQLPNCSWSVTNMPSVAHTYTTTLNQNRSARSGSKFAAFAAAYINNTTYFYTNGLQLNAGVTYSASMWFMTEYYGYTNVTNLSMMVGPNQSTTGLVNIVTSAPAASSIYKSLSNTFTVPTSGIYYIAIKETSNGNYGANYLSWDDLAVEIPCALNMSTITLSPSTTTLCSGQSVNITATGADTYTWNTGANGSSITDTPNNNFTYNVVGTSTLTGCTFTQSQAVMVNPSPNMVIFADEALVCSGSPVHLTAYGATTYTWNNSSNNPYITVNPTVTTNYIVIGSNTVGCQGTASQQVSVTPLPVITAVSSAPNQMCAGETQMLTGSGTGVVTFQWAANTLFIQSPTALISPTITTTYTLTGINAYGCAGKTTIVQNVDACTGLNEVAKTSSGVKVYPNPTAGLFTVELNSTLNKTVVVTDVTGRIISTNTSKDGKVNVNISNLSNGIYYVKIQSDTAVEVIKVVKQ